MNVGVKVTFNCDRCGSIVDLTEEQLKELIRKIQEALLKHAGRNRGT